MSFEAKIEDIPFTKALVINSECKMMAMPKTMSHSFGKVMSFFEKREIPLTGIPFTRYENFKWSDVANQSFIKMFLEMFTRKWSFQCGLSVDSSTEGEGDIQYVEYSPGKAISCIHVGPYHKVGKTYKNLYKWSQQKGYELVDLSFELYLNDPKVVPPNQLETKLIVPIR